MVSRQGRVQFRIQRWGCDGWLRVGKLGVRWKPKGDNRLFSQRQKGFELFGLYFTRL